MAGNQSWKKTHTLLQQTLWELPSQGILHNTVSGRDVDLQRCAAAVGLMNGQDAVLWPGGRWHCFGVPCVRIKSTLEPGLVSRISLSAVWLWWRYLPSPFPLDSQCGGGVGPEEAAVKRLVPGGLSLQKHHMWLVINHCILQ